MDRQAEMLSALVHSHAPISGEELGARLGVSSRTIRIYVRALNRRAPLIAATHRGYVIDREVVHGTPSAGDVGAQSPATRLLLLCRYLAAQPEPTSIHELANMLFVSQSTLSSDLRRARDALRRHDLVLRRYRSMVWTDGSERSRRRVVREMLVDPRSGLISSTWRAFCSEYERFEVKGLRERLAALVGSSGLELNEFALTDVVMHLVVSLERVGLGRILPAGEGRTAHDLRVVALCDAIKELVEDWYGVSLPPGELEALEEVLAGRVYRTAELNSAATAVVPELSAVVAELMDEVAFQYLLGRPDRAMLLNLTLHVQSLVARARAGTALAHPLGEEFKSEHPLVHDLALCFAGKLEARLGIEVAPAELDYLGFHLGMQYMLSLEERDLATVALVVPHFHDLADRLGSKLSGILRGQAVIEEVTNSLGFDFTAATSDLIVSCIEPEGPASAPVVVISPFLTSRDTEHLLTSVRRVRERTAGRRVQTTLATLIDPRLFLRDNKVESREAAIGTLCHGLREAGHVGGDFVHDVISREHRSSTCFGGEVAFPHSMHMNAEETSIAVLISEKGIPWGSERVRLVFLMALGPDGRGAFRDIFVETIWLLESRASVASLVASHGLDQFLASLSDLIDGESGDPP